MGTERQQSFENLKAEIASFKGKPEGEGRAAEILRADLLYAGYLTRQNSEIRTREKDEAVKIPNDFNYLRVGGLSAELREKLERTRPQTLAAAGRIEAMTPAALGAIFGALRKARTAA